MRGQFRLRIDRADSRSAPYSPSKLPARPTCSSTVAEGVTSIVIKISAQLLEQMNFGVVAPQAPGGGPDPSRYHPPTVSDEAASLALFMWRNATASDEEVLGFDDSVMVS
jgi:hypothetical protein